MTTQGNVFDLSQYGVAIEPDPRLIVMNTALELAGFEPTPGKEPSEFRRQIRRDFADINADLRQKLKDFFARNNKTLAENKLNELRKNSDFVNQTKGLTEEQIREKFKPSPAEQAERYVSLAYSLSSPPDLASPERTDDLPGGLLEVLDFAPLIRDFYRHSVMYEKLSQYTKSYQTLADEKLRRGTAEMVRDLTSYLNTRPQTVYLEKIVTKTREGNKGKTVLSKTETRERERRFYIIPDLLAVPGTINFRNIGDDYYAIVPETVNPQSSELRRAFLQYLLDPLVLKNGRAISVFRDGIKSLLAEREKDGLDLPPDIFLAVARSLVAAADARQIEFVRVENATFNARALIDKTPDVEKRKQIVAELNGLKAEWADETLGSLAEAYKNGAVLAFYFADQLKGTEANGFDIASSFADMITSFEPAREKNRLAENAAAINRNNAMREARKKAIAENNAKVVTVDSPEAIRRAKLVGVLQNSEELNKLQNYDESEKRLTAALTEFPDEAKIFFALGRTAGLSAQGVFDEEIREQRLGKAVANYSKAIQTAKDDKVLLSRSLVARARIFEFLDRTEAARNDFNAAVALGALPDSGYREALAGKQRLAQKP